MKNRKKEISLILDGYDKLELERGALSEQEQAHYNELTAEFDSLERTVAGRATEPNATAGAPYGSLMRLGKGADGDWQSFGHYASAVKAASARGAMPDPRLVMNAPTTTSTEGVGADGGFAVPDSYA
jgi:hypothetical protein